MAARPRWVVRSLAVIGFVLAVASPVATLAAGAATTVTAFVFPVTTGAYLLSGGVLMERRPGNRVGAIVLAIGIGFVVYSVLDLVVRTAGTAASTLAAFIVYELDGPFFFLAAMLFLFFPDGRLPSPRWRWLVATDAVLMVAVTIGAAFKPGPFAYYPWITNPVGNASSPLIAVWAPAYGLQVVLVAVAAASLVGRWRRAGVIERAQLKWVAAAAVLLASAMLTYGVTAGPGNYSELGDLLVGIGFSSVPVAIAFAVLRYRLYEIDRIISRTIGWALVTGLLVAVFAAGVVALQTALAGFTQGQTLAVAASTLLAFALFQPLRRRVQLAVDRRFNRARYDAARTVDAFAARLRSVIDLGSVQRELQGAAAAAVEPRTSEVWIRAEGRSPRRGPGAPA